jgi:hypothetical protein
MSDLFMEADFYAHSQSIVFRVSILIFTMTLLDSTTLVKVHQHPYMHDLRFS